MNGHAVKRCLVLAAHIDIVYLSYSSMIWCFWNEWNEWSKKTSFHQSWLLKSTHLRRAIDGQFFTFQNTNWKNYSRRNRIRLFSRLPRFRNNNATVETEADLSQRFHLMIMVLIKMRGRDFFKNQLCSLVCFRSFHNFYWKMTLILRHRPQSNESKLTWDRCMALKISPIALCLVHALLTIYFAYQKYGNHAFSQLIIS